MMNETMASLARKHLAAAKESSRFRHEMIRLIQQTDMLWRHNEPARRIELRKLQREFYLAALASILRDDPLFDALTARECNEHAEKVLDLPGYISGDGLHPEGRRTFREHQHYGNLRVRWSDLAIAAGMKPIRKKI